MSVKETLKNAREKFVDATPVLPEGVRVVTTRERSASEVAREADLVFKKRID